MTRVIGAALLALRAVSCPVRLDSHLSGELCLGRYLSQSVKSFTSLKSCPPEVFRYRLGLHISRWENSGFSARALSPNLSFSSTRVIQD